MNPYSEQVWTPPHIFDNMEKQRRRSIRLKGYDYSQAGLYFITICTHNKKCLFGNVIEGEMVLNDGGEIAKQCLLDIPKHFPNRMLLEYIVMPNHIHMIIQIVDASVGVQNLDPLRRTNRDGVFAGVQNLEPLRCFSGYCDIEYYNYL